MIVEKDKSVREILTARFYRRQGCICSCSTSRFASVQYGFTLVEAIIVITLIGIISAVVAIFIRLPVQGYVDSVNRADLTDTADTALRRMARDIRLALPNSLRADSDPRFLELLLTKTGGRYLGEDDGAPSGNPLKFDSADCTASPSDCKFDVVGTMPTNEQTILAGDYFVVYNLGPGLNPADAYDCGSGVCNRALVAGVNAATNTITLGSNPFANQPSDKKMKSPTHRFQVVSAPVTYFCDGAAAPNSGSGELRRYWGYPIQAAQPVNTAGTPLSSGATAILATGVQSCTFSYQSLANTHSGLITLSITIQNNGESITLVHQVHVDNTP